MGTTAEAQKDGEKIKPTEFVPFFLFPNFCRVMEQSNKEHSGNFLRQHNTGLLIFKANLEERIKIHNWVDKQSESIYCIGVWSEIYDVKYLTFINCFYCDEKMMLDKYHYGFMKNNKDESVSGECKKCGEFCRIEPNYDDTGYAVPIRNVMVVGPWIERFIKDKKFETTAKVTDDEIEILMKNKELFIIKDPKGNPSRKNLGKYIFESKCMNDKKNELICLCIILRRMNIVFPKDLKKYIWFWMLQIYLEQL